MTDPDHVVEPVAAGLFEAVVMSSCAYEAMSLAVGDRERWPPISCLCWRRPVLIPVILGGLGVHLVLPIWRARRAR